MGGERHKVGGGKGGVREGERIGVCTFAGVRGGAGG